MGLDTTVSAERLVSMARPALATIFSALIEQTEAGDAWRAWIETTPAAQFFPLDIERFHYIGAYVLADALALVSDNVLRYWADGLFEQAWKRKEFGEETNGMPFGKFLWAAGNAARHYTGKAYPDDRTEEAITQLGVTARDESVVFRIWKTSGLESIGELLRRLDATCREMESAADPRWKERFRWPGWVAQPEI